MKLPIPLVLLSAAGTLCLEGATWFVRPDGSPAASGQSWAEAVAHPAQAADRAGDGDEIWVAAGQYVGDTVNLASGVRLLGGFTGTESASADRSTNAALTVLEATNSLPLLNAVTEAPGAAVLVSGFTLQAAGPGTATGRGLVSSNAVLEVENCVFQRFRGGTFSRPGSAIVASGGSLRITATTFSDNQTAAGGIGAAIGCQTVDPVEIHRCEFLRNRSNGASALELNQSAATVTGCLFARNTVSDDGVPGVIELYRSRAVITRNRFLFNRGGAGAAIFVFQYRDSVTETNRVAFNVFAGNVANEVAGAFPAATVSCSGAGRLEVINNTFAGEVSLRPPGGLASTGPLAGNARSVQPVNNLFLAHHQGDPLTAYAESRRNVFLDLGESQRLLRQQLGRPEGWADEELVGGLAALDFHLQPGAVSRGLGDPSVVSPETLDLSGRPALHADGTVDVGALAFDPGHTEPVPPTVIHLHPDGNDQAAGDSWTNAVRTLPEAIRRVSMTGATEIWFAGGRFAGGTGPGGMPPGVTLRGSFVGFETNRLQRDRWLTTELNASQTNALIALERTGRWNEIEGLILNGAGATNTAFSGGALTAVLSWPHVHHCRFENHSGRTTGVALYSEGGIVEDCEFTGNSRLTGNLPNSGGSILHITGRALPAIFRRNVIRQNTNMVARTALAWFGSPARVEYCAWLGNRSGSGTQGLMFYGSGATVTASAGYGCWHNTIVDNEDLGIAPSVFQLSGTSVQPQFLANLVAHNRGEVLLPASLTAFPRDNLLFDNGPVPPANPLSVSRNLFVDPRLADDRWHLRADSPARDAVIAPGDAGFATDVEGEGAWLGSAPDIGADETLPDHPLARTVASAVVTGNVSPATLSGTWRDWEDTCPDCHARTFVREADGYRLELSAAEFCPEIACTGQLRPVDYPFDFGPATPGVTPLRIGSAGRPLRTLSLWVRPPLAGHLRLTRPATQNILSVDGHPGVPVRLEGTTNFVDWQAIAPGQAIPFMEARPDGPWFFRSMVP